MNLFRANPKFEVEGLDIPKHGEAAYPFGNRIKSFQTNLIDPMLAEVLKLLKSFKTMTFTNYADFQRKKFFNYFSVFNSYRSKNNPKAQSNQESKYFYDISLTFSLFSTHLKLFKYFYSIVFVF